MKLLARNLSHVVLLLLVVLFVASQAGAEVMGTNPFLDDPDNDFYIPLKGSTSGTLGDRLCPGFDIGLDADTVCLLCNGATSSGYVSLVMNFDLTGQLPAGQTVDPDSANLLLTFRDIDFKVDVYNHFILRESMDMTFLRSEGDAPGSIPDLIVNESNYEDFAQSAPPVETDNTVVTYMINLADDLNLTTEDFDAINENESFALFLTFRAELEHTRCWLDCVTNSPEDISVSFGFNTIPEPVTMMLLVIASPLVFRRRRR